MNDDLDLEGNWASGSPSRGGGDADDDEATEVVGATAAAAAEKGQKRKKKASSAAASGEKPAKVSKKASAASKKHESKSTQGAEGSADADDGEGPAKKKKKSKRRKDETKSAVYSADQLMNGSGDPEKQAKERLEAAWAAEGKARKLSDLELKELQPKPSWFLSCSPEVALRRLPTHLEKAGGATMEQLAKGQTSNIAVKPGCIGVVVLCLSTERAFQLAALLEKTWKIKPLTLCTFGGGRKKDQLQRQGRAIEAGVPVAVATPGRLSRLLDDGHAKVAGMELVVVDLAMDLKQRDVLSLPETRRDFFQLFRSHLCGPLKEASAAAPRLALCGKPKAL